MNEFLRLAAVSMPRSYTYIYTDARILCTSEMRIYNLRILTYLYTCMYLFDKNNI